MSQKLQGFVNEMSKTINRLLVFSVILLHLAVKLSLNIKISKKRSAHLKLALFTSRKNIMGLKLKIIPSILVLHFSFLFQQLDFFLFILAAENLNSTFCCLANACWPLSFFQDLLLQQTKNFRISFFGIIGIILFGSQCGFTCVKTTK